MLQSATFDKSGVSIDTTEFDSKSVNVYCSDFLENKLSGNTFG